MIVLDVNVLIARFRDDHAHYDPVRAWWDKNFVPGIDVAIPDLVWVGFLRVVTNHQIFPAPANWESAYGFLQAVTQSSAYVSVPGLNNDWATFNSLSVEAHASANIVPDAYIASIAVAHACPVVTMDRDFRRFAGLQIIDPLAG
jgi:uncharacterized protein